MEVAGRRQTRRAHRAQPLPGLDPLADLHRHVAHVQVGLLQFGAADRAARYRMYISGDTLVYDDIREIPRRFPDIDLALLHLGGTRILKTVLVTMDAKQGVQMLRIIEPRTAIPIHYDDYTVFKSPLSDFQKAVKDAGLEDRVEYLDRGETFRFGARPGR